MANLAYGAIPEPMQTIESLQQTVVALKMAVEVLARHRKPVLASAVTWQDLIDRGLIAADEVPLR